MPKTMGHGVTVDFHRTNAVLMTFVNYTMWDFQLTNRHYLNSFPIRNSFSPGEPFMLWGTKNSLKTENKLTVSQNTIKPVKCALSFWDFYKADDVNFNIEFKKLAYPDSKESIGFSLRGDVTTYENTSNWVDTSKVLATVASLISHILGLGGMIAEKKVNLKEIFDFSWFVGSTIYNLSNGDFKRKVVVEQPAYLKIYSKKLNDDSGDGYTFSNERCDDFHTFIIGEYVPFKGKKMQLVIKVSAIRNDNDCKKGNDLHNTFINMDNILIELFHFDDFMKVSREIYLRTVRQYITPKEAPKLLLGQALDLFEYCPIDLNLPIDDEINLFTDYENALTDKKVLEKTFSIFTSDVLKAKKDRG